MANIQTFPQSLYPIKGDVESQDGNPNVTVVAVQNEPWATDTPQPGQIPVQGSDGVWHPEDPVVSGTDAIGTPSTANPVQVAGIDDGNLVRELRTDTYGGIRSVYLEHILGQIVLELRGIKSAILNLDNTALDSDYRPDNFTDIAVGE